MLKINVSKRHPDLEKNIPFFQFAIQNTHYFHQRGYIIGVVCLSVCKIITKIMERF